WGSLRRKPYGGLRWKPSWWGSLRRRPHRRPRRRAFWRGPRTSGPLPRTLRSWTRPQRPLFCWRQFSWTFVLCARFCRGRVRGPRICRSWFLGRVQGLCIWRLGRTGVLALRLRLYVRVHLLALALLRPVLGLRAVRSLREPVLALRVGAVLRG